VNDIDLRSFGPKVVLRPETRDCDMFAVLRPQRRTPLAFSAGSYAAIVWYSAKSSASAFVFQMLRSKSGIYTVREQVGGCFGRLQDGRDCNFISDGCTGLTALDYCLWRNHVM